VAITDPGTAWIVAERPHGLLCLTVRGTVWTCAAPSSAMRVPGEGALPAMNRRLRFLGFRPMSGVSALVAGIAFFAVPSQAGYANTTCDDCYILTPATAPSTAGAGTGKDYAFQVTNNDPHETLRSLTFTAPARFVITGASGPGGTSVSALPGSSVTLKLPDEPTGTTFTVDITALAPCVAASSEVWGVSGIDSRGETNEVRWKSSRSARRSPGIAASPSPDSRLRRP
jgi:hypothetical protein